MNQLPSANELARELSLSEAAMRLAAADGRPDQWFGKLREARLHGDAIRLLPHLLPKRRAVWWGCLCVWQAHRQAISAEATAALRAAVQWIEQPTEAHRRGCEAAARAADLQTSPGCVAMAAFWSGGSMSRPELPLVPPPPGLTAKVIAGAVLLAAAEHEPHRLPENYEQFLLLGEQVARGELPWQTDPREAEGDRAFRPDAASTVPPPHWLHSSVLVALSSGGRHHQHRHVEIDR